MENTNRFSQINLAGLLLLLVGMGTLLYIFINLNEQVTNLETKSDAQSAIIEALKFGLIRNVEKFEKMAKSIVLDQGISLRSCNEYASYGIIDKGEYLIDPDGYGGYDPFNVICDFRDTAIVTKVFQKSFKAPSRGQLISLLRNSNHCEHEFDFLLCSDRIF